MGYFTVDDKIVLSEHPDSDLSLHPPAGATQIIVECELIARFATGTLLLEGEKEPCAPAALTIVTPREAELTLTEGRDHQVRRMFAAGGPIVLTLQRVRFGELTLDSIAPGTWRELPTDHFGRVER